MNSQQKRVKWSRGETASALEERTDTGITQVSVKLMSNAQPDVYGNISRRKALKFLPSGVWVHEDHGVIRGDAFITSNAFMPAGGKGFIFSIDANTFVIFFMPYSTTSRTVYGKVIENGECTREVSFDYSIPITDPDRYQFAQYGNFMVITSDDGVPMLLQCTDLTEWTFSCEQFNWDAPWVAPSGTQSIQIQSTDPLGENYVAGMEWNEDELGFESYTYTDNSVTPSITTIYSSVDTGLEVPSIVTPVPLFDLIPNGSVIQFPNMGCYFRLEGYFLQPVGTPVTHAKVIAFGSLLTPTASSDKTDTIIKVETGYQKLDVSSPTCITFSNQRLAMAGFSDFGNMGNVVASQIGRYNDFKNDYGLDNEPSLIQISSKFQEKINWLVDYNGLKAFGAVSEYNLSIKPDAAQLNSKNGSSSICEPLVFKSMCFYCDSSLKTIRAMQYEFQSNLFNSSSINLLTQLDMIDNPKLLSYEVDKTMTTGDYLYALQPVRIFNQEELSITDGTNHTAISCFMPGNQVNAWSRYEFPKMALDVSGHPRPDSIEIESVVSAVNYNDKTYFLIYCLYNIPTFGSSFIQGGCIGIATLEDEDLDLEVEKYDGTHYNTTSAYIGQKTIISTADEVVDCNVIMPSNKIAIFNAVTGVFIKNTYINTNGTLGSPITETTTPKIGYPIDARIVSHQIDINSTTKTSYKRISKALCSIRNTADGSFTINKKTGYFNLDTGIANFYNCTGNKKVVNYEIENVNGAKFTIESLTMNLEYGTLTS